MTIFGSRDTWAIEIEPLAGAPNEPDPAAAATWTSLRIWAGGRNLTAHTRTDTMLATEALRWPAAFLARWFINVWDDLWSRAGWPLRGPTVDPRIACANLDAFLAKHDDDVDEEFLDRRDAFVRSHTLLAAAAGGVMPHVYLMREGRHVHVAWDDPQHPESPITFHARFGRLRVEASSFLEAVRAFVEWCRTQVGWRSPEFRQAAEAWLAKVDSKEGAAAVLAGYVHPWGARNGAPDLQRIGNLIGLPADWHEAGALLDVERFPAAIVYRALAPVMSADDVSAVIGRLRSVPANPEGGRQLALLGDGLNVLSNDLPHVQGYQLAEQVRRRLGNHDQKLDIEALLSDRGVAIGVEDLSDEAVDAATVWDADHGPVVLLNRTPAHSMVWARRMSLAHELCHLLVDRGHAAEVMVASTPWAPPEIERRANAFAAELLLPKAGMTRVLGGKLVSGWVTDADRKALMDEFCVGETVCSHQLKNRLQITWDLDDCI